MVEANESDQEPTSETTRLDALWAARDASGPSDAEAGAFLDAVLAEGLICPVWSEAGASGEILDDADALTPMLIDRDGVPTLCVFDSIDRLAESDFEATEFAAAPGRLFFGLAAESEAQIALNPGVALTDMLFSVDTVAMIAALAEATEQTEEVGPGQVVDILAPLAPSAALLHALAARLSAARGLVGEAWLTDVARGAEAPGEGGKSHPTPTLILGAGDDVDDAGLGALASELGRLGAALTPETGLDVAILNSGDRALEAARRVGVGMLDGDAATGRAEG